MSQTHLVGISSDPEIANRLKSIADEFEFKVALFKNCDELNESFDSADSNVLVAVLAITDTANSSEIAGQLQVLKYSCQDAYTILVVDKKIPADGIAFIKKSGADIIIHEADVFETSFLEFILSQRIRGSLIAMKHQDFKIDSEVTFKVMTMLPLAHKLLPVFFPHDHVKASKLDRLKGAKELYVGRDDVDKVQEYLKKNQDLSAEGIVSRCRVNYSNLCKSHTDFITILFDKSDRATFSFGKELLDNCAKIASEMLMNLSTLTDPWAVINNNTIGETGSVERSPAISAMAGLMTMSLDGVNTEETILAGLLCDIGILSLHPSILRKMRQNRMNELTADELAKYQQHPVYSINRCLDKKIPLTENLKKIIMTTHEKLDQSGFPKQLNPDLISKESQLLQYCEFIDQNLLIKMGSKSESSHDLQMKTLAEELSNKKILDISLVGELKKYLSMFNAAKAS